MKQTRVLAAGIALLILTVGGAHPASQQVQPRPYRVVFDLTSPDPLDQQAVLRWIKEISATNPKTEFEVVMYGKGLDLVVPAKSTVLAGVKEAMAAPRVSFKVCAIAMKNQQIEKGQLLPNVEIVPDGIGEIVAKQREGWGYIKVTH